MASLPPSRAEPSPPLLLTIRFTTAIPDLHLDVAAPDATTVVALKQQLRAQLEPPTSQRRLRLIHSGKLLRDDDILCDVLKMPPSPPPAAPADPKGKGKAVEPPPHRVYINCSIGDALTSAELAAEVLAAATSAKKREKSETRNGGSAQAQASSTTAASHGFERLLSGGFSRAEVNQLRLQFRSIQSNIHTPETMPSPETLLRMEDAWIDDNGGGNAGGGGGGGDTGGFDFGDGEGALDDLLWGNIMGFLWPLGCVGWLIREEGVWSGRKKVAVATGFMLSLTFGMLRVLS